MHLQTGTIGVSQALSGWLLGLQILMVLMMAAGFVSYYRRLWHYVYDTLTVYSAQYWAWRIGLLALTLVLGIGFHLAATTMSINAMMFHDVGLFFLSYTLLDRNAAWWEFLLRVAGVLLIWWQHFATAFGTWPMGLALVGFMLAMLVVWRFRDQIRYNPLRHIGLYAYIGALFWLLMPANSVGMQLNWAMRLQGIAIYLAMACATGFFMHARHIEDRTNRANAQLAHFDALTDTFSASLYQQTAPRVFAMAKTLHQPLFMAVIDIDHFKQVNDHYGHLVGDELLSGVAKAMTQTLHAHAGKHALYRAGGEEFNILFENMPQSAVTACVQALWQVVRERKFTAGRFEIQATVSIGVAAMLPDDQSVDNLYARADENLYQSKHNGRDTISIMGTTAVKTTLPRVMATRTLLLQHVFDTSVDPIALVYDDLILAKYVQNYDRWDFPDLIDLPLTVQMNYLHDALAVGGASRVMLNLRLKVFADEETPKRLAAFRDGEAALSVVSVELTELPPVAEFTRICAWYHAQDVRVILKNVDPLVNLTMFAPYLALLDGVKLRVADLHACYNRAHGASAIAALQAVLVAHKIDIIVSDVENSQDAAFAKDVIHSRFLQGYFFDRPALPRLS